MQHFLEKAPGQNWEKMIDLMFKLRKIDHKHITMGAKFVLKIKFFLDCLFQAQVI